MTAHADLRAILEALPNSSSLPLGIPLSERCWILSAPALVRDLLEERDALKADRDKLADEVSQMLDDGERLDAVDAALGEDRKKAPFIDDAVKLLRKERDALKAEVERLRKPSVIRDGFPPDSLLEEAARLGRELANSLDDLWREGRRRVAADRETKT